MDGSLSIHLGDYKAYDKVGLYSNGKLLQDYPNTPAGVAEAVRDAKFSTNESGILHYVIPIPNEKGAR